MSDSEISLFTDSDDGGLEPCEQFSANNPPAGLPTKWEDVDEDEIHILARQIVKFVDKCHGDPSTDNDSSTTLFEQAGSDGKVRIDASVCHSSQYMSNMYLILMHRRVM